MDEFTFLVLKVREVSSCFLARELRGLCESSLVLAFDDFRDTLNQI